MLQGWAKPTNQPKFIKELLAKISPEHIQGWKTLEFQLA